MSGALSAVDLPVGIAHESMRFLSVLQRMGAADPWKVAAVATYVQGFRAVAIAMTAISPSGLAASVLIKHFSMDAAR